MLPPWRRIGRPPRRQDVQTAAVPGPEISAKLAAGDVHETIAECDTVVAELTGRNIENASVMNRELIADLPTRNVHLITEEIGISPYLSARNVHFAAGVGEKQLADGSARDVHGAARKCSCRFPPIRRID